jgi:hypothetical protein
MHRCASFSRSSLALSLLLKLKAVVAEVPELFGVFDSQRLPDPFPLSRLDELTVNDWGDAITPGTIGSAGRAAGKGRDRSRKAERLQVDPAACQHFRMRLSAY